VVQWENPNKEESSQPPPPPPPPPSSPPPPLPLSTKPPMQAWGVSMFELKQAGANDRAGVNPWEIDQSMNGTDSFQMRRPSMVTPQVKGQQFIGSQYS
tara:strand:+ start:360 stop:653 length:294 start_codon:yes stop_codon:yes gene_type:complete